jgi:hypothetical protein
VINDEYILYLDNRETGSDIRNFIDTSNCLSDEFM